ncbi:hypothetical protein STEG23_003117 [Scotinomys teguina]
MKEPKHQLCVVVNVHKGYPGDQEHGFDLRFHEMQTRKQRKGVSTKQLEVPATVREDSEMFPCEHLANTEIVLKGTENGDCEGKYCYALPGKGNVVGKQQKQSSLTVGEKI